MTGSEKLSSLLILEIFMDRLDLRYLSQMVLLLALFIMSIGAHAEESQLDFNSRKDLQISIDQHFTNFPYETRTDFEAPASAEWAFVLYGLITVFFVDLAFLGIHFYVTRCLV